MNIKTFKGGFFEFGKQQGEIYKRNGMDVSGVTIDPKLYRGQRDVYEKHYPELLEEFGGIAAGGGFDAYKKDTFKQKLVTSS